MGTSNTQTELAEETSKEIVGHQKINYQIFSDLSSDDVRKLETAFQNLFRQIDSIAAKKSIFRNAGIDDKFIDNLDFNLNINEFASILTDKFLSYKVSSQNNNYHPMMILIDYIIKRHQQYNLDDAEINFFNEIVAIGKEKLEVLTAQMGKYDD